MYLVVGGSIADGATPPTNTSVNVMPGRPAMLAQPLQCCVPGKQVKQPNKHHYTKLAMVCGNADKCEQPGAPVQGCSKYLG